MIENPRPFFFLARCVEHWNWCVNRTGDAFLRWTLRLRLVHATWGGVFRGPRNTLHAGPENRPKRPVQPCGRVPLLLVRGRLYPESLVVGPAQDPLSHATIPPSYILVPVANLPRRRAIGREPILDASLAT